MNPFEWKKSPAKVVLGAAHDVRVLTLEKAKKLGRVPSITINTQAKEKAARRALLQA